MTEAKILAKPILITNYSTANSQIDNGFDGVICDLSVDGLVQGIEKLYSNPELRNTLIKNIKDQDYQNDEELIKLYKLIG